MNMRAYEGDVLLTRVGMFYEVRFLVGLCCCFLSCTGNGKRETKNGKAGSGVGQGRFGLVSYWGVFGGFSSPLLGSQLLCGVFSLCVFILFLRVI